MKVLATLTLTLAAAVAAVAVAARSADVRAFEGDIQINKITYTDDAETEVCIGGGMTFPKNEMIELWVTTKTMENQAEVSMLTNYKTENTADGDSCILFEAESPPKDKIVEYVVAYMEDGDEVKDGVSFIYNEAPETYTFTCNEQDFTRSVYDDPGSHSCINDDISNGLCYEVGPADDPVEMCTVPLEADQETEKDFVYCQSSRIEDMRPAGESNDVKTLSYIGDSTTESGELVLTNPVNGDVVMMKEGDDGFTRVVTVSTDTAVSIDEFARSTGKYASCVVEAAARGSGFTVTEASKITDLDVQGTYSKQGGQNGQGGKSYYEFGFQSMDATNRKFHAKSGQKAVTINCEQIDATERCYGYLQQDDDTKTLTISYADDTNTITVSKDSIAKPTPP